MGRGGWGWGSSNSGLVCVAKTANTDCTQFTGWDGVGLGEEGTVKGGGGR